MRYPAFFLSRKEESHPFFISARPDLDFVYSEFMKTILVVEDVAIVRELLVTVLEQNYQVVQAASGWSALEQAIMFRPDLVVLDVNLPGDLSGLEVCAMLRADFDPLLRDVPILILSGMIGALDEKLAREIGANAFLSKPYSPAQLLKMVAELLA